MRNCSAALGVSSTRYRSDTQSDSAQVGLDLLPRDRVAGLGDGDVERLHVLEVLLGLQQLVVPLGADDHGDRLFQDEDGGFELDLGAVDAAYVDAAWDLWRGEVAHARAVLERTDLDALVEVGGEVIEVRDVVVHMVEEYARHLGHVDLIRECLDGRTGQ